MKTLIISILIICMSFSLNTLNAQSCCGKDKAVKVKHLELKKTKFNHNVKRNSGKHIVNKNFEHRGFVKMPYNTRLAEERKDFIKHKKNK